MQVLTLRCVCGRYCSTLTLKNPDGIIFYAQYCNFCDRFANEQAVIVEKILSGKVKLPFSKEDKIRYKQ